MRRFLFSTILTGLAGYAWRNRHRFFSRSDERESPADQPATA